MQHRLGHQEFWCSVCDENLVNSEKPESGQFYVVSGHTRSMDFKEIIFAVCACCNPLDAIRAVRVENLIPYS